MAAVSEDSTLLPAGMLNSIGKTPPRNPPLLIAAGRYGQV